jgi:hypothetical protein
MKYQWIQDHQNDYPMAVLCQILRASRSGYIKVWEMSD